MTLISLPDGPAHLAHFCIITAAVVDCYLSSSRYSICTTPWLEQNYIFKYLHLLMSILNLPAFKWYLTT